MKNLHFPCAILLVLAFAGCRLKTRTITDANDYNRFLELKKESKLENIDEQITFWSAREKKSNNDLVAGSQLAALLSKRFSYSGNIAEIKKAEELYEKINLVNKYSSSSTFRALAALSITQHQFRRAKSYLDSALLLGDDKFKTLVMLSDVAMELGDEGGAIKYLDKLKDENNFEVLIRKAKLEDKVNGNLEKAIQILEHASNSNEAKSNETLINWLHSNLGDMYAHAGRFTESYNAYLSVLKRDPEYYHCLKGIAWLAFSHDKNSSEAKRILRYLKNRQALPDYDLLLAIIAEWENNMTERQNYLEAYERKLSDGDYGAMYNTYTLKVNAEWLNNPGVALAIARKEVKERPTTISYSLLSWSMFINGYGQQALNLAKSYVEGRSMEPDVLYRLGIIYAGVGNRQKARKYLLLAKKGAFELGPVIEKKINTELMNLDKS